MGLEAGQVEGLSKDQLLLFAFCREGMLCFVWELCSRVPSLPLTHPPLGVGFHLGSPFLVADHAASGPPLLWSVMLTASFRGKDVFPLSGEHEHGQLIGRRWACD